MVLNLGLATDGSGSDIRGLSQYPQERAGIEIKTRPLPFCSTPFSTYYSPSTTFWAL